MWDELTWAPGKSWSLVIVVEYLFSTGCPSRVALSGRWGNLRYLGSSKPPVFVSMVVIEVTLY